MHANYWRLASLLLFLFPAYIFAQTTISGSVFDISDFTPLPGVNVQLIGDEGLVAGNITDANGLYQLTAPAGDYEILFSFIGYKSQRKVLQVAATPVNMRKVYLRTDPAQLEEVLVREQAARAQLLGDTTEFNADAYKTNPEANAEDLLEKMPGVVVQDGQVQAQGEQVRKVLVDGRPFFDNDVNAALRNLPAEIVDRIQIFDQESEQAQFTGFSTGETTKTVNIITKPGANNGQFGKLFAGYGTDERYSAGGSVNIFNQEQRISLIGQLNNINQQNFSAEDLVGVLGSGGRGRRGRGGPGRGGQPGGGPGGSTNDFLVAQQDGIAETQAFGINFSDEWGEKVKLTASYFFNHSDNIASTSLDRLFATEGPAQSIYLENSESRSNNTNHRISGRLEYQINDQQSILFRPRISYQLNDGTEDLFGESLLGEQLNAQTINAFQSDLTGLNIDNNLLYRIRLNKPRRTLSINFSGGYTQNRGDNQQNYAFQVFRNPPPPTDSLNQKGDLDQGGYNYGINLSATEPLGRSGMLMANYRYNFRRDDSDISTFDFSENSGGYDELNELQSSIFTNDYRTHEIGMGYNLRVGSANYMARINAQWANLDNEQDFPLSTDLSQQFFSLQPMLMARYGRRGSGSNLRFIYRASASAPSTTQLQEVLDNSNPLLLSIGNSSLKQSMGHNLFMRWNKLSADRTKVFYGLIGGSLTSNYIGSATYFRPVDDDPLFERIELPRGSQLTQAVNLDGQYSLRGLMTYGLPVSSLKSNLNFSIESNLSRTPSLLDGETNLANSRTYGTGLTISSNISEKVDFTIGTNLSLNTTENSLREDFDNQYFNQRSRLKLNLIFGPDLVFNTQLTHQYYDAFSEDFDQNFFLLNLSLGKQIFANRRGKIAISVFDALEQNNALQQNVTGTYIENLQSLVLQRYYMLTFSYQLRHFGKIPETTEPRPRRPWGGPRGNWDG